MQSLLNIFTQFGGGDKTASRRGDDLIAWEQWKNNPSEQNLEVLFNKMAGIINGNVNKWVGRRIPKVAIKAEAEKLALQAFKTYNPVMGASLATYVNINLQKLYGFIAKHGDLAKIPEGRFSGIRKFKDAEMYLREKLRREPSAADIADYLKISIPEVNRYRSEDIQILTEGGGADFSNIKTIDPNKRYALEAVYFGDLTPDEKVVYEYLNGRGRPKVISTGKIATLTGMSAPKVANIKKSIAKKLERYL